MKENFKSLKAFLNLLWRDESHFIFFTDPHKFLLHITGPLPEALVNVVPFFPLACVFLSCRLLDSTQWIRKKTEVHSINFFAQSHSSEVSYIHYICWQYFLWRLTAISETAQIESECLDRFSWWHGWFPRGFYFKQGHDFEKW